jgi:hypothetical protein
MAKKIKCNEGVRMHDSTRYAVINGTYYRLDAKQTEVELDMHNNSVRRRMLKATRKRYMMQALCENIGA